MLVEGNGVQQGGGDPTAGGVMNPGQGNAPGGQPPQTPPIQFTPEQQAYVNKIVSERVNETKSKFQGYDDYSRKAQILDGLLKDPDFTGWLNGDRGGQQMQQGQQDPLGLGDIEDVQGLLKVLPQLIQQSVQPMLKPFEQMAGNLQTMTRVTALNTELQRMSSTLDEQGSLRYPGLHDAMFRNEVERIMADGRAGKLDDAYALANFDRQQKGQTVPTSAYLLNGRVGGGLQSGQQQPAKTDYSDAPKFTRPEDALNYVTKKLGL